LTDSLPLADMTVNQVLCDMHHQLPSTAHKLYECTQGLFSSYDYGKYFFFQHPWRPQTSTVKTGNFWSSDFDLYCRNCCYSFTLASIQLCRLLWISLASWLCVCIIFLFYARL